MTKDRSMRINSISDTSEMIKSKCKIINTLLKKNGATVRIGFSNMPKSERYLYHTDAKGQLTGTRLYSPSQKLLISNMDAIIYGLQTIDVK